MRLVAVEFMTLDGVIQALGSAAEDPDGFAHGGWSQPFFADHGRYIANPYRTATGFVFGRRTFEIFQGFWPTVTDPDNPIAHALNTQPKYVVSTTMTAPHWQPTTIIALNVTARITELKDRPGGDLIVVGSAQLAHHLITDGLIDEYQLWIHPIVADAGKRLFPPVAAPIALDLIDTTITPTGLIITTYRPANGVGAMSGASPRSGVIDHRTSGTDGGQ